MLKALFRGETRGLDVRIGILFSKLGITPNLWTVLALVPALAGFYFLYMGDLAAGLILFVASAFMDVIDGTVARVTNSVSNLGAFLDGVVDRYVEFALYIGLWFYMRGVSDFILPTSLWFILLVIGAVMPSFVTAYADHRGVVTDERELRDMGGVMERFERLTLIYAGMFLALFNPVWLNYVLAAAAVLTNFTALQRIIHVVSLK